MFLAAESTGLDDIGTSPLNSARGGFARVDQTHFLERTVAASLQLRIQSQAWPPVGCAHGAPASPTAAVGTGDGAGEAVGAAVVDAGEPTWAGAMIVCRLGPRFPAAGDSVCRWGRDTTRKIHADALCVWACGAW